MDSPEPHEQDAMVRTVAKRVAYDLRLVTVELEELVAYGYLGLLEAEKRFDPSIGVKFEAFAYRRIRGAILDGVRSLAKYTTKVHAACKRLALMDTAMEEAGAARAQRDEKVDPLAMLAAIDGMTATLVTSFVLADDAQVESTQSPENANIRRIDQKKLRKLLPFLPEDERRVLHGMYYEDESVAGMADVMGISKSNAGRLHLHALELLRARLT